MLVSLKYILANICDLTPYLNCFGTVWCLFCFKR